MATDVRRYAAISGVQALKARQCLNWGGPLTYRGTRPRPTSGRHADGRWWQEAVGRRRSHRDRTDDLVGLTEHTNDEMLRPRRARSQHAAVALAPEPLTNRLK